MTTENISLAEKISACGFDQAHPVINEQYFPLAGEAAEAADLLTVSQKDLGGEKMTTAQIEAAIDLMGCRRGTLAELLVHAMTTWNGRDCVVALGSFIGLSGGDRTVPCVDGGDGRRVLGTYCAYPVRAWRWDCLFLVVRK